MKNSLIALSALISLAAAFFYLDAKAQEGAAQSYDNGIILFMEGDVKVKSDKSDAWLDALKGMVLVKGDNLKTGKKSWAEIGFGKDFRNSVRVQENTHVIFTDLGATKINLIQGELRSLVERLSKNAVFEIKTPVSVCGVRGTGWDTITNGKTAETDVYENTVYFAGLGAGLSGEGVILEGGKMGLLLDPEKPINIEDLPVDKMYDWNKWKQDFIERRDALTGPSPSDRVAGAEDLQAVNEGGMDTVKPVVSDVNDERDIDRRIQPTVTIPSAY